MKKGLFLLSIFSILLISGASCDIKELSKPIIKQIGDYTSSNVNVSGSAYPGSKIVVFVNDNYITDGTTDTSGNFNVPLIFETEGVKNIKIKQLYKQIESDFSESVTTTADLTPPSSEIIITTTIPKITNAKILKIQGKITEPQDILLINGLEIDTDNKGRFVHSQKLIEGNNQIDFSLKDKAENKTGIIKHFTIKTDSIAPTILTGAWGLLNGENKKNLETEEILTIKNGDFWGYFPSMFSMPIEGSVKGELKYITLDNKRIYPDENGKFFQKIPLYLDFGTNKFKVIAEDTAGNKSSEYLTISISRDDETTDTTDYGDECCKYCSTGKACGDSCISRSYTCHQPPGCACDY